MRLVNHATSVHGLTITALLPMVFASVRFTTNQSSQEGTSGAKTTFNLSLPMPRRRIFETLVWVTGTQQNSKVEGLIIICHNRLNPLTIFAIVLS